MAFSLVMLVKSLAMSGVLTCPELSSGSYDLQRSPQCFSVTLPGLQKYTHMLRVNSIAS